MIGIFFLPVFMLIVALCAVLFSILAWRLRTDTLFWLGVSFTALLVLLLIPGFNTGFLFLILLISAGISIGCLIASKMKPSYGNGTGVTDDYIGSKTGNNGPVTEEYLNEILNSPDEEIDFE